jgi:predicted O-methyltransferase YrrM
MNELNHGSRHLYGDWSYEPTFKRTRLLGRVRYMSFSADNKVENLYRRAKSKLSKILSDFRLTEGRRESTLRAQEKAFENAGLTLNSATIETASLFANFQIRRTDDSVHYEIGTSGGHFTLFLAKLFPAAEIHTWDLPSESFSETTIDNYLAIQDGYGDQTIQSQSRLDGLTNVVQVRRDSTQLIYESKLFDAIWVDGDHTFPVVAFDVINALRLVPVGGWICVDDIRQSDRKGSPLGLQETYKTVKHLASTGLVSLSLVRKRMNVSSMLTKPEDAKYIAIMRRLI